jgi:hypothetical protein
MVKYLYSFIRRMYKRTAVGMAPELFLLAGEGYGKVRKEGSGRKKNAKETE